MGLATLEDVEDGLTLGFQLGGLGGVFAEHERAGDEADDEGDEDGGDHRLFGDEFDADERAEVGGGLRGVEDDHDLGRFKPSRLAVVGGEGRFDQSLAIADHKHGSDAILSHWS